MIFSGFTGAYAQNEAGVEPDKRQVEAQGSSAMVEEVSGTALLQKKGGEKWERILVGTGISDGDQVSVTEGSVVMVNIDGNVIKLQEGTLFTFTRLSEEKKLELWRGRIRAKVKQLSGREKFEILTPVAVCAVRGTEFEVEVGGDLITRVRTYSGAVAVKNLPAAAEAAMKQKGAPAREVIVREGSETLVRPGGFPQEPAPIKSGAPEKMRTKTAKRKGLPEAVQKTSAVSEAAETSVMEEKAESRIAGEPGGKTRTASALGVKGSFGAEVLSDPDNPSVQKIYYSLSFMPEFSFWKIGVGFDFNIYFDEEGNVREEDWDSMDDAVKKIRYVRYGQPEDTFYLLAGGLDGYSLGHGFIVNRYTNMLGYPDVRKTGAVVNLNFNRGGLESFVTDIEEYPVIGGRIYYKPLFFSGIPLIENMETGLSCATDPNPDKSDATEDDEVVFYGGDISLGLVNFPGFSSALACNTAKFELGSVYGDISGQGMSVGLGGNVVKFINYGMEYRKLDNNFQPGYFDRYYEVDRVSKPASVSNKNNPVVEGPYAALGFSFEKMAGFKISYEDLNRDVSDRYPYLSGNLEVFPPLLMNRYSLSIAYDKKNVNSMKDLSEPNGAIMTTRIGYMIAPNVMLNVVQKQTFDSEGKSAKTFSVGTSFEF